MLDRFALLSGSEPTPDKELSMDVVFQALVETHHLPARFDDEALRVSQLSAPIFDPNGVVVASLLVLGSSELMTAADLHSLGAALTESTATVTRAIGGASAHHPCGT
jgi:DNA-binding IclR family transcriptional regulator